MPLVQGLANGSWYDERAQWSKNHFPTICDDIEIPSGKNVQINTEKGWGFTFDVLGGLDIHIGAEMEIATDN